VKGAKMGVSKVYAYIRKSTDAQNTKSQELAVYKYADENGLRVDHWFDVDCSSRKSTKERRIDELLDILREGDTLIVSELSRLGRSVGQVITIVDQLIKKKIKVICLKENIRLNGGRQDIQSKVMVTMFSLFAEIERDLISERTKEGLARARAEGKQLGRPKGPGKSKLDPYKEEIIALLKTGSTKTYLAKKYGVTPPTLYNWLNKRQIKVKLDM
jgi:DNA invertase Pin-like site-specific DNA recombinase